MEKTLVTILVTLALLIGAIGGTVFAPAHVVYKDKIVKVPVNVSVEKIVKVRHSVLNDSVAEFMNAVKNEEDAAGNTVNVLGNYDFDEIEVSRVYDKYNISYNGDKIIVDFRIRLRFHEEGEPAEKDIYNVTVIFEKGEDTIVTAIQQ